MSMKETLMFPVMKHDVRRFILRPSHYLISSSEQAFKLLDITNDELLIQGINNIINNNQKAFIQDFETALLFNNKVEHQDKPFEISFSEWWNACPLFNLDYTFLIALYLERNKYEVSFDDFIDQHIDVNNENESDFIIKLVEEMVKLYDFKNIYNLKKYTKIKYPETSDALNNMIRKTFRNTPNFLNLISLHNSSEEAINVLSSMHVSDIDLQDIVLSRKYLSNKLQESLDDYDKEKLYRRLSILLNSSIFDTDDIFKNKEFVFEDGDKKDKEYRKKLAYIYKYLKHEEEKEIFLNTIKARRNII